MGRQIGHIGQTSQTLYLSELYYEEAFLFPNRGQTIFLKIRLRSTKSFPRTKPYTISNLICQTFVFGVIIYI
jgi:hypothetical protein